VDKTVRWQPIPSASRRREAAHPGLERISVSLLVGVPEAVALEHLERFATEVRPAFKTTAAGAAVVD
jgi:hypothetical protein